MVDATPNLEAALSCIAALRATRRHPDAHRWVVGIGGIPASGKSTCAALLAAAVNDFDCVRCCTVVSMDGFHFSRAELDAMGNPAEAHRRRGAHWTFDLPKFASFVQSLAKTSRVRGAPTFDHAVGDPCAAEEKDAIPPEITIVLVEGLYCLLSEPAEWAAQIRDQFDARIMVECSVETAAKRIIARHVATGVAADAASAKLRWESSDLLNAEFICAHLDCASVDASIVNDV